MSLFSAVGTDCAILVSSHFLTLVQAEIMRVGATRLMIPYASANLHLPSFKCA